MTSRAGAAIPLNVATDLVTALVSHIAVEIDARAMIVKGRTLEHHGLRRGHTSLDVDVLADPRRATALLSALAERGWRERAIPEINRRVDPHSWSLVHDDWPCDIDLHYRFPGFALDPQDVFEALWSRHELLTVAQVDVAIADRPSSILILGLHSLRDSSSRARHRNDLATLTSLSLSKEERGEVGRLAEATGSVSALTLPLAKLGVTATAGARESGSAVPAQWRARVLSDGSGAWAWWQLWRMTPWHRRHAVLGRALWPSRRDLRAAHPHLPPGALREIRARGARLLRGVRSIPRAIRAARKSGV
jgi:hypothetical protein